MSTATTTAVQRVAQSRPTQDRIFSLDLFRGATMAAMIIVNNQNGQEAYWPLQHSAWNGWTPADLIFPFFLFIVGVSLVFSFHARLERGESRRALTLHTIRRSVTLFAIGLALNGLAAVQFGAWRIPGVLQRIAVVYCIAAILALHTRTKARIAWVAGLLLVYWMVMRFVPVPGYGVPSVDIPLLHPDGNLAAYLDRKLMLGHLWEATRDPEGILSTIPSIATALCGVLTGEWLRSTHTQKQKAAGMLACGVAGVIAGQLWGLWFPINKNLWTSSYVLLTSGSALIALSFCYWLSDIHLHRGGWSLPFMVLGTNAISAYVISQVLGGWLGWSGARFLHWLTFVDSAALASLLHAMVVLVLSFIPMYWLYRKRIFIKV